jgi:hypothetical protein
MARHLGKNHWDLVRDSAPSQSRNSNENQAAKRRKVEDIAGLSTFSLQAGGRLVMLLQTRSFPKLDHRKLTELCEEFYRCLCIFSVNAEISTTLENALSSYLSKSSFRMPPEYLVIWQLALQDTEYYPYLCWRSIKQYKDPTLSNAAPISHDPFAHQETSLRAQERLEEFNQEFLRIHGREVHQISFFQ